MRHFISAWTKYLDLVHQTIFSRVNIMAGGKTSTIYIVSRGLPLDGLHHPVYYVTPKL